jgi:N-acetyl-anhydromuramoyl-L-alanine amidase
MREGIIEDCSVQIKDGYLSGVKQRVSPNRDSRPAGEISLLVIHCISLPEGHFGNEYVEQLFCNTLDCTAHPTFESLEQLRVSSHLVIRRDGSIEQYVCFLDRAWHAGVSTYQGRERCNDFSIGIELEGTDKSAFTSDQYDALGAVCDLLYGAYPINDVVGHSDIAPGRKTDPGTGFDWSRIKSPV